MEERREITPYRMNQLMKAASKITDQLVNSVFHLTSDEMDIVLKLIQYCMNESRDKNRENGKEV